jgi:O-antigen/teichoic acid export membrane protein
MTPMLRLARRIPLVTLATIAAAAAGIVFQVLVSRRLEPDEFGTYAAVIALLYALCQPFESYALVVAKQHSRNGSLLLRRYSLLLAGILGAGSILVFVLYVTISQPHLAVNTWAIIAAGVSLFVWSILWLLRGSVQGLHRELSYAYSRSIELWSRLGLGILLLALTQSIAAAIFAGALGACVAGALLLRPLYHHRDSQIPPEMDIPLREQLLQFTKMSTIYLPMALFIRLDMILAPRILATTELGAYGVMSTVGKAVLIYSLALSPLVFPYIVESKRRYDCLRLLALGSGFSCGLLVAAFIVFQTWGHSLIPMAFGSAYSGAAEILPLYILALIPLALHCNVINLQLAIGRLASVPILWIGLLVYFLVLRFAAGSGTDCLICIAAVHTVLSLVGLLDVFAFRRLQNPAPSIILPKVRCSSR